MNPQAIQTLLDAITSAGAAVVRASWQGSVLAVLVLAAQRALRGRVAARWLYLMWGLVLLRLALPAVPASPVSLFNLAAPWMNENATVAAPPARNGTARTDAMGGGVVSHVVEPSASAAAAAPTRVRSAGQEAPARSIRVTWQQWLAVAWVGGVVLFALRVAWASVRVGRFVRAMGRADDSAADALLRSCADALGVRHPPELRCDDRVQSPALVGWIRPKLLLPQSVIDDFDPTELRMIFLHELAHQKRRDVLVNWLATALQVVHWFNPVVWLVMWRVRTDREVACDELVLSLTRGADRRAYGRTILKLLETLPDRGHIRGALAPAAVAGTGVGILEGKHQMKRRITMIAQFGNTTRRWTAVAAILALALAGALLTDAVRAQSPQKPAQPGPTTKQADDARAMAEAAARPATAAGDEDPITAVARRALETRLPEVRFDAIAFEEVVNFLRDVTSVNIFVNWRALEAAGIDRSAPVTVRLRDVRFRDALDKILEDVGGGTVTLDYVVDRGTITISTDEDLSRHTVIQIYEVSDLLTPAAPPATQPTAEQKGEQLMELIQNMIASDSWRDAGGTVGSISLFDTRLVVIQTPKNHERIEAFLKQLRAAKPAAPAPKAQARAAPVVEESRTQTTAERYVAMNRKLDERAPNEKFDRVTLAAALNWFQEQTGLATDIGELTHNGVSPDTPISFSANGEPWKDVLNKIVSAATQGSNLEASLVLQRGGAVLISVRSKAP